MADPKQIPKFPLGALALNLLRDLVENPKVEKVSFQTEKLWHGVHLDVRTAGLPSRFHRVELPSRNELTDEVLVKGLTEICDKVQKWPTRS